MYRGSFVIRIVGVLLLVGVLFAVGALAFRYGQSQGYTLALAAAGEELPASPAGVPGISPGYGYWGWPGYGFMPFFPLFCLFGLGLVFLFALGAIFRPRHWHGYGRVGYPGESPPEDWHGHWHGWHAGPPPKAQPPVKESEAPAESKPAESLE